MTLRDPSNPKNKFDYVGDIHNQIVSEYISKYGREKRPTEEICQLIDDIASQNEDFQKRNLEKVDCEMIKKGVEDFNNQFKNIVNSLDISSAAKNKLQELIDYLFELAFKSENTSYSNYYDYVIKYETEVMNNEKFSKKDLKVLLSSSSTARYSVYLWKNELKESRTSNTTTKRKWWQWAIIGAADIGGTAAGGVSGGAAASTTAYTLTNPKGK